jgi:hypothetical protein
VLTVFSTLRIPAKAGIQDPAKAGIQDAVKAGITTAIVGFEKSARRCPRVP